MMKYVSMEKYRSRGYNHVVSSDEIGVTIRTCLCNEGVKYTAHCYSSKVGLYSRKARKEEINYYNAKIKSTLDFIAELDDLISRGCISLIERSDIKTSTDEKGNRLTIVDDSYIAMVKIGEYELEIREWIWLRSINPWHWFALPTFVYNTDDGCVKFTCNHLNNLDKIHDVLFYDE